MKKRLLKYKSGIIYGPVESRRLGRSLGVNLLPPGAKTCIFNCLYCQYGWTDFTGALSFRFPDVEQVFNELEKALESLEKPPDYITFSGNGEPTLHPKFGDLVEGLDDIRNRLAPLARTAVLSNSGTVHHPAIRKALSRLDVRIMKFDSGTREMLQQYNGPLSSIDLDTMTQALGELEDITIQALFTGGDSGNLKEDHLFAWLQRIRIIRPRSVQIYSLDRAAPSVSIEPISREGLVRIQGLVGDIGIPSQVF